MSVLTIGPFGSSGKKALSPLEYDLEDIAVAAEA
jgi:hypothetical protein